MFLRGIRDLGCRGCDDRQCAEENAADYRDSDRTAEALHRADDATGGTGFLGIDGRHNKLCVRRDEQSAAESGDKQRAEQVPVDEIGCRHQKQHQPNGDQSDGEHSDADHQHLTAEDRREPTALGCPENAADRERNRHEARLEGGVPESGLPQDGNREEDAGERREVDQRENRTAGESRMGVEVWRHQRASAAFRIRNLPQCEQHNEYDASSDKQVGPERPAKRLSLDERHQNRHEAAREKRQPDPVDSTGGLGARARGTLRQQGHRCDQCDDSDRHVHVEHIAPALLLSECLDEQSTDDGAERGGDANDGTHDGECRAADFSCEQ